MSSIVHDCAQGKVVSIDGKRVRKVPDARTIWAFKEQLVKKNIFGLLFEDFDKFLGEKKLILNQGVIIDGSFVEVPRQRNSREENKAIKAGHGDGLWASEEEKNKREGGAYVRGLRAEPARDVQPGGGLCTERGPEHPDKPGLQRMPL